MEPTHFIDTLCEHWTLVDRKHGHYIYLSDILTNEGVADQTNFITAAAIVNFESDAYGITPGSENKVDIFCKGSKIMTVDTRDFEVCA